VVSEYPGGKTAERTLRQLVPADGAPAVEDLDRQRRLLAVAERRGDLPRFRALERALRPRLGPAGRDSLSLRAGRLAFRVKEYGLLAQLDADGTWRAGGAHAIEWALLTARAYRNAGRAEEMARRYAEVARRGSREDRATACYEWAREMEALRRFAEAETLYARVVSLGGNDAAVSRLRRGICEFGAGRWSAARARLEEAAAAGSAEDRAFAWFWIYRSELARGRSEAARAALAGRTAEVEKALDQLTAATEWFATNAATIQQQWTALRAQLPADVSPNEYLESQLTLLRDGGTQLKDGGHELASGTAQLAGGVRQLSDGLPALVDGIGQVASGADQLADGLDQYIPGVVQLADGIGQAHDGSVALASGLVAAHDGSVKLADGMDQLATGLADGAKQIPSYTDLQRENLAKVVASPISTTGLDELVTPAAAAVSLLLVLALWLGALATYALIKPVDPRNASSSSTTRHLVVRALLPGFGVAAVQAAILAALGGAFLGVSPAKGAALFGALLLAGLAFAAVNHALAAWAGVWGRLVSGVFLLITGVTALTFATPGVFDTIRGLSPLSPALDAVRAILTWQTPALMLVTLAGWLAVGVLAGAVRILRSRTVSVKQLALAD